MGCPGASVVLDSPSLRVSPQSGRRQVSEVGGCRWAGQQAPQHREPHTKTVQGSSGREGPPTTSQGSGQAVTSGRPGGRAAAAAQPCRALCFHASCPWELSLPGRPTVCHCARGAHEQFCKDRSGPCLRGACRMGLSLKVSGQGEKGRGGTEQATRERPQHGDGERSLPACEEWTP